MKNCAPESASDGTVGDRLREERVRLNLKQEDLAQAGGVNRNTQGSYERGARNPDSAYLVAISGLGVDVMFVLTGARSVAGSLSAEEAQIIVHYRHIPEQDQRALRRFLKAMFDDAGK
ncbi:helix-turn-helix transcriptional regulator [Pseudomonas chlororaphis]|nr:MULTISPECIES: helix-turn-helix transcriptional regulator [Pseudomonas]WJV21670.1 helix-turn-helix transcriptional regulator [Pseudomonas chlororaphis]